MAWLTIMINNSPKYLFIITVTSTYFNTSFHLPVCSNNSQCFVINAQYDYAFDSSLSRNANCILLYDA